MRATESERRDWAVIAFILLFGLFWILLAGSCALRFTPRWEQDTNVQSLLDPNSDFLTNKPVGFIEPVDPAILTNPAWMNAVLTPGASFPTITQLSAATSASAGTASAMPSQAPGTLVTTGTIFPTTTALETSTTVVLATPTNTFVYFPPSPTSTSRSHPVPTSTPTASPTGTMTPTQTSASSDTATPTATATSTTDPIEPDFGGPDGNTIVLGNGMWVEFNLSGFFLDGDSAWDLVYYEKEETSSAGKIHLGVVVIEVYDETTTAWYTIYNWGDGVVDVNASYNNGNSEPDGFPVDKSLLYGVPPLNTGIAIDIDSVTIGQGGAIGDSITRIRITSLSNLNCDIDSIEMLR